MNKILETLEAEREELADWRHDFHMHPELGLEETRTAGIVAQKLRSWGIEVTEHVGVTGVVGVINGDLGPGRSIGLRCDMDALPITECSSQSWKSTVKGKMHACGHDGHTTMLLAAARYLSQHRNFRGRVVLVFQPAEEGVRGAGAMAASGVVDDVDTLIGAHVGTFAKLGTIGLCESGFLASTKIDVHFHGRPSHAGADPEKGRSALMAACAAAMMMQGIPRSGEGTTRIAVGRLNAGEGRNVTPVHADMQLEVRGETGEINQYMVKNVENIVEGVKRAYEVEAEIVKAGEATTLPSCPEVLDLIESVAKTVPGVESIERFNKPSGSEDCTLLIERVVQHGGRGAYFLFGCNHHGHHRADFEIQDETSLPMAFNMFKGLALRLNGI